MSKLGKFQTGLYKLHLSYSFCAAIPNPYLCILFALYVLRVSAKNRIIRKKRLVMFFFLSSVSGRTPLRESLESFIGIVDEHPITIVRLSPLHMGEVVLDW